MATYIILSRFADGSFDDPSDLNTYARAVADRIRSDCPDVQWKQSFATSGSVDVVDIVESDDPAQVQQAALIIRALGYADTETLVASEWSTFLDRL